MNKNEILELVKYIEKTYPNHIYLNQHTDISNVHLYKLIDTIKQLIK